jgi:hypothetical protein
MVVLAPVDPVKTKIRGINLKNLVFLFSLLLSAPALSFTVCTQAPICSTNDGILLNDQRAIRFFEDGGDDYAEIKAPASLSAPYSLTLPVDDGTSNQVLTTDGSGVLTWETISGGSLTIGDGISGGTANYVLYENGSNDLAEEQYLDRTRGGTGITSTATFPSSGTVTTDAGSSTFTNKTFDADGSGNAISNIENADIKAGAAIARTKLASGSNNHVIINDGSGVLSSEAQLAGTRGGTGVNSTATFPTSGVVVTEAAAETLTNKTIPAYASTEVVNVTIATYPASGDLLPTDQLLLVSRNGTVTIMLPDPSACGRHFKIKDTLGVNRATNAITLSRFGSESIEGVAANYVITASYGAYELASDCTNWWVTN